MKINISPMIVMLIQATVLIGTVNASNSSNYAINIQAINNGGGSSQSISYAMTSSVGGIAGLGTQINPETIARSGFQGQLYEISSVLVSAIPEEIYEGGISQLSAVVNLDDGSLFLPANNAVQWLWISGPVDPPSPTGEVAAQIVHTNMPATVGGAFAGISGEKILTIIDSDKDNFAEYSGDGIDDDWQVAYFGLPPNPDADPYSNPDSDPDDNLMEFLAGFDPTDPTQWFQLAITGKTDSVVGLRLNKVLPGRIYTIQAGTDLDTFPQTIITFSPAYEEFNATVTDDNATEEKKFYRVDVTMP